MKLKTALDEMEVVLNELNEQFETIKKNEVRVPQIEIDIIMATMRRLYESVSHLNKQKPLEEVSVQSEIQSEEIEVKEDLVEEEAVAETETVLEGLLAEEMVVSDVLIDYEKVTDDFQEEIDALEDSAVNEIEEYDEQELEAVEIKAEVQEDEKPKSSLLLQFEDEVFSVNDSVAQKGGNDSVVNKLNNTRIENLKSAIGINDKFYFINELFSGNSQAYEDVIYTLNNFKRFEEAMQYTSTLKYKYEWSNETEAYQKLTHFLERKFVEIHA